MGALAPLLTGHARLQPRPPYAPYRDPAANDAYNRLFGDTGEDALPHELAALQTLAADENAEGTERYLAYARLRRLKVPVPPRALLGVIVELPGEGGLSVLAGYSHGTVRVLQPARPAALIVGMEHVTRKVRQLFAAARPAITHIGPWARDRRRLPPPAQGTVRLSFLLSDGWYFGEGPRATMEQGEMGGPIIHAALDLLRTVSALHV